MTSQFIPAALDYVCLYKSRIVNYFGSEPHIE